MFPCESETISFPTSSLRQNSINGQKSLQISSFRRCKLLANRGITKEHVWRSFAAEYEKIRHQRKQSFADHKRGIDERERWRPAPQFIKIRQSIKDKRQQTSRMFLQRLRTNSVAASTA